MKVFSLPAGVTPREQGRAHGEAFAPMIAELARIRLDLTVDLGGFDSAAQVLALAERHIPVLEAFDADLHAEFIGIAEGAGIDTARLIVLNHYTDLRDISPLAEKAPELVPAEDDCTAAYARTDAGALLGQTWDMHGSATHFVMMLHVPAHEATPEAWVFSITGCLGMTGMNSHGLGITINNLKSLDAEIGIVWPALVRRVLREQSAEVARDVILDSPLGSGHHYLVATNDGAFGIETSGKREKVVFDGTARDYVHTNHCLDAEMAAVNAIFPGSTTKARYDWLTASAAARPIANRADLWSRFGSHDGYPRSVCTHVATPEAPHKMRTCGGLVMDLAGRDLWATAGCLNHAEAQVFGF